MNKENPFEAINKIDSIECGEEARKYFQIDPNFFPLNHGSYGTYPLPIRSVLRHFQDAAESRTDHWIQYDFKHHLRESRTALATYLHAPASNIVFVLNATTGTNTVLRNLVFNPGDVIISFATVYNALNKTIQYIEESTPATSRKVNYTYPISDDFLCNEFVRTIHSIRAEGKNPRIALFDTIVSMPGARMPFERLTQVCKDEGVLSCIDGAHSVGQIPINLGELDPDFFVSNCHKWLLVPRGCAVFYVARRSQGLVRSTIPTSHFFEALPAANEDEVIMNGKTDVKDKHEGDGDSDSYFIHQFSEFGTADNNPYLCIPSALQFRSKITWNSLRGEDAIYAYLQHMSRCAAQIISTALGGAQVLENEARTLGRCSMTNIKLPLDFQEIAGGDARVAARVNQWLRKRIYDYNMFIPVVFYGDAWWVRISAQVYVTERDFEYGGEALRKLCERCRKGEWKEEGCS